MLAVYSRKSHFPKPPKLLKELHVEARHYISISIMRRSNIIYISILYFAEVYMWFYYGYAVATMTPGPIVRSGYC